MRDGALSAPLLAVEPEWRQVIGHEIPVGADIILDRGQSVSISAPAPPAIVSSLAPPTSLSAPALPDRSSSPVLSSKKVPAPLPLPDMSLPAPPSGRVIVTATRKVLVWRSLNALE